MVSNKDQILITVLILLFHLCHTVEAQHERRGANLPSSTTYSPCTCMCVGGNEYVDWCMEYNILIAFRCLLLSLHQLKVSATAKLPLQFASEQFD